MKRFVAQLNGAEYMNLPADHLEMDEDAIYVYNGSELVAYVDKSVILTAHISERTERNG